MIEETTEESPPQGVVIRYMSTGIPSRDFIGTEEWDRLRRIDPACFGEVVFLALPLRDTQSGPPVRWRIRQYNRASATEVLTWAPKKPEWRDVRLATDAEVAQYRAEEAARAGKAKAERERIARAELERQAAKSGLHATFTATGEE